MGKYHAEDTCMVIQWDVFCPKFASIPTQNAISKGYKCINYLDRPSIYCVTVVIFNRKKWPQNRPESGLKLKNSPKIGPSLLDG